MVERDSNYRLIKEIERHPLLYNFNLEEYSNKSLNEKAWKEVGRKTNMSVGECKEKWRNIRSTYNRSKKPLPRGFRAKKTYYLAKHLAFVLPYMKTLARTPGRGIPSREEDNEVLQMEASEDENSDPDFVMDVSNVSTVDHASHSFAGSSPTSQRTEDTKRHMPEVDNTLIEYLKEHRSETEAQGTPVTSPMQHFFLSLMGEFDTMTEHQIRHFKIRVLQLIDEIKTNPVKSEFPAASPEPSYEGLQSSTDHELIPRKFESN